jgi:MoaD family protein
MKIEIRFIGRYQDIIGKSEQTINLHQGDTIWDVLMFLAEQYPEIEKDKKFIMVSKNNTFTHKQEKIKEGDQITIFPPVVAGG